MALIKIVFALLLFGLASSASIPQSNLIRSEESTMTSTTSKAIHEDHYTKTTRHLQPDYIVSISHWFLIVGASFLARLIAVLNYFDAWPPVG